MAKVSPIQNNFNSGELTPLLYGRPELENYKAALAVCLNSIPLVQGPITRRSGTYFCDEVKDSSKLTRAYPFKFSTTQAYMLEIGDQYFRFKRNEAPVTLPTQAISAITNANPAVLTYVGADTYANGDMVDVAGVVGMEEVNARRFTVANVNGGANTFELSGLDSTGFGTYVSGGTVAEVFEIASPYLEAEIFQLKFTQSADVLYIFHPNHAPRKLSRTGHTSWTLSFLTLLDGPYMSINSGTTTLTPSATTGTGITITASAVTGINSNTGFQVTDVGRLIRLKHAAVWGYVLITGHTSTTVVTADVIRDLGAAIATVSWRLGLYSGTTLYPSCGTFFEDRLFLGGSPSAPQRFDGSKTGDYENFAPTATDGTVSADNSIGATLNSDDVQIIRWMRGDERGLLIGTVEGEWLVRASTQSEALSATNIKAVQFNDRGSADISALRVGKGVLFVQRTARTLREIGYTYEIDGFSAEDMSVYWEHLTKSGVKEMSYQQEPQPIVWMARNDGELLGVTYAKEQKVLGWHRHSIGGYSDAGHTLAAQVESVAVIPSPNGDRDQLWMVVKRWINGAQHRYFEFMMPLWDHDTPQESAFYVDGGRTYSGAPVTSVSGLHHLAGETVAILADGATHPDQVVSADGEIELDRPTSLAQVGYAYNSDGQMLRLDAGAADGTAQGKTQRTHRVVFRLHQSLGLKVGPSFEELTRLPFRLSGAPTATAVPLFTGDKDDFSWEGEYTSANYVCWRWDQPLPGTIVAIMPQLHTQDR
jgi:hypothetical protein